MNLFEFDNEYKKRGIKLLAGVDEVAEGPKDTFMMFNNADIKFPVITGEDGEPVEITHGKYISLLESQDRSVREAAFKGLYDSYGKFINTISAKLVPAPW